MPKNLVIVESPAKAKTIEGYLGKDYTVASSYGHVRDLPKGDKAIDIQNGFAPTYEITADKTEIIKQLRKLAKESETVYLASDDDREGEAISWHLKEALSLNDANTRRIVFREITKKAIENAIQNPRGIDIDLVNAQQARRILDRLVGFELSPILWKKIKSGLSAGRVQSVAVRLVVEREREVEHFEAESSFKITATFSLSAGKTLRAELVKKLKTEDEARAFLEKCLQAEFSITNLEKRPGKRSPAPPFTTSTLQQEASRKLSFSVSQTMVIAQKLYESGKISYMRTDSLNLSDEAISGAAGEIRSAFGNDFVQTRKYKTKSESAQEAHEAIRPTDFSAHTVTGDRNEQRLYELIWKRAIASQMADAQIEKTIATIGISTTNETLTATGEVIQFEGFLKVYIESTDDDDEEEGKDMLPPLKVGELPNLKEMTARESFTRPHARYTEASLVKQLEEMGIGRPSTYAPTISTIQKREYIIKEQREGRERNYRELKLAGGKITAKTGTENFGKEKMKLFPTSLAMVVNDFLVNRFPNVIDYTFTARVEKEFDEIASGRIEWQRMIDSFYGEFHSTVEDTEKVDRSEVGTSRELGTDPSTGKTVVVRLGRFGPIVQIGEATEDTKPRYASLKKGQLMENITLEEAFELFKLPREVGSFEDSPMVAAIGRFGPYIKHGTQFYSLPKDHDPMTISEDAAIAVIKAKRDAEANKLIMQFDENKDVQILNGRYGPYIKFGKQNVKIPKGRDPKALTYHECLELAEAAPPAKKGGFRKKTK